MRYLKRLSSLLVLIVALCFVLYFSNFNRERAALSLPPWIEHISIPIYLMVLGSFMLGAVIASLYFALEAASRTLQIRQLKRDLERLKSQAPSDLGVQKPSALRPSSENPSVVSTSGPQVLEP